MSKNLSEIGSSLENGVIPKELSALKDLGTMIKNDPKKYAELRESILNAETDEERVSALNGFVHSEKELKKLSNGGGDESKLITITTTTTTTIFWPTTGHAPEK